MRWDEKVFVAIQLLNEAMEKMTREEWDKYALKHVNPAYEALIDSLMNLKHDEDKGDSDK